MYRKFVFVLIACTFIAISCKSDRKDLEIQKVEGYFSKNDVEYISDVIYVLPKNLAEFEAYFGSAATLNYQPDPVDFENYKIACVLVEPNHATKKIEITHISHLGKTVFIDAKIDLGKEQRFKTSASAIVKLPKNTKKVVFTADGDTVEMTY
ncbi:MAG: hypothetical protein OIF50_06785 [Flavobacteriaceae bacterium]|nr:hypothetical protein [Flavobacteriaceae bacterium]